MTIRYQKKCGFRLKSQGFYEVTTFDGYWWVYDLKRWVHSDDPAFIGSACTHFWGCRSVRAFRRRLKEWQKYLPKGVKFILVSRWVGYDVYGTT